MADDNNVSIGDILWEYADYTPPEETAPPPSGSAADTAKAPSARLRMRHILMTKVDMRFRVVQ